MSTGHIYEKMEDIGIPSNSEVTYNIPKIFWKYYDLYRRGKISINQYVEETGLAASTIKHILKELEDNKSKGIASP